MKKFLSLLLTLALLTTMCVFTSVSASAEATQWDGQAATSFSGGDGSKETPYQIGTAAELKLFANIVNGEGGQTQDTTICGILTADIVLNTGTFTVNSDGNPLYNGEAVVEENINAWFPIGYYYGSADVYYKGTFNGGGHTVSGVYFSNTNQSYVGLFGQTDGAELSNLGIVNSYIRGNTNVGGVYGYTMNNTNITGCYNTGTVSGNDQVGGVCGYFYSGTITGCYNTGTVSGGLSVGGICGDNYGTITDCYNTGEVSGAEYYVGGVCGYTMNNTNITGCYNTGTVSGNDQVGGVCGYFYSGTITGCYNTGTVSGNTDVGGVFGYKSNGTITGCYYLDTCGAGGEGTSKTADEMKTQTFTDTLNENGGSFVFHGTFPMMKWQTDDNRSLTLTYTVASDYIVTIPGEVTLDSEFTVSAEKVVLEQGKQLQIALTATSDPDNTFKVTNGGNGELTYEITNGNDNVAIGNTVLTVNPATSASGETTLNFSKPKETPQFAGTYSGTVTFTVSVTDAPTD